MGEIDLNGEARKSIGVDGTSGYSLVFRGEMKIWSGVLGGIFAASMLGVGITYIASVRADRVSPTIDIEGLTPVEFGMGRLVCTAFSEDGTLGAVIPETMQCVTAG